MLHYKRFATRKHMREVCKCRLMRGVMGLINPRHDCLFKTTTWLVLTSCLLWAGQLTATTFTLSETKTSSVDERIEATQNGGASDTYKISVSSGKRAVVCMSVSNVDSSNISGRSIYVKCNSGSEQILSG